jgi:ubiquinol-cytochrome c reductase cytochrome b subunit
LHFFLPFVIAALSLVHLALLHKDGSNNPLGVDSKGDKIPFYPYFVIKDLFAFFCFLTFFGVFVLYFPNALGHPDNYIRTGKSVLAIMKPEYDSRKTKFA